MELKELAQKVHQNNRDKGFWDTPREFGTLIALMHSELSEALEADRKDLMDDKLPEYPGQHVEVIDCLIRILDYLGSENVEVDEILDKKLDFNKSREHKHGKKY